MNNKLFSFIDLHLHLDGAIDINIARKLAKINNISLPNSDSELNELLTVSENCESLNDFLKCFELPLSLLQTKETISEAVFLVLNKLENEGLEYAEIRFAPQLHLLKDLTQEDTIKAAIDGIKKSKIKSNLILCLMRGNNNYNENKETVELAKKYLVDDGGVVAIDLAGAEGLFKTKEYKELFELANNYKIPFTIHAGEADDYTSVDSAISYGTKRIGHCLRAIENDFTIKALKENDIYLEMCPTSNRLTKAINDMTNYPLLKFINMGLKVTINTDDPAIENTTLLDEYNYLDKLFNINESIKKQFVLNAIDAAFTTTKIKNELKTKFLNRFYKEEIK